MFPQCMLLWPWEGKFLYQFFFLTTIFSITSLTIFLVIFPTPMSFHRCFREEHFSGKKMTFRETVRFSKNFRVAWVFQYDCFTCFMNLPFSVSMDLNQWRVEMVSDPSKYMFLIVWFYQRSVPFFLYWFQWCCYLDNIPIWNTVSWYISTGGVWYVDYRHCRFKNIFMDHGY